MKIFFCDNYNIFGDFIGFYIIGSGNVRIGVLGFFLIIVFRMILKDKFFCGIVIFYLGLF